jgi:hypothetical protein
MPLKNREIQHLRAPAHLRAAPIYLYMSDKIYNTILKKNILIFQITSFKNGPS